MRAARLGALAALGVLVAGSCVSERAATGPDNGCASGTVEISIQGYAFSDTDVCVRPGTTVVWTNREANDRHTTTSDTGVWDSGLLSTGQQYSRRFTAEGTFPYHCTPHPTMRGRIVVRDD